MSKGQKPCTNTKPTPVAIIKRAALDNSGRALKRWAMNPTSRHQDCRIWSRLRRQPPQAHKRQLPGLCLTNERRGPRHRRPKCLDGIGRCARAEERVSGCSVEQMQPGGVEAEWDLHVELD